MKRKRKPQQPLTGMWRNGDIYYHFSEDLLTVIDFSRVCPQIMFLRPNEIERPVTGWKRVSSEIFFLITDRAIQLKFDQLKQWSSSGKFL